MTNYQKYKRSRKEWLLEITEGIGICLLLGLLFYRHIIGTFALFPLFVIYLKQKEKEHITKQRQQLEKEFKDVLAALAAALQAGYSIERAILRAKEELISTYSQETNMMKELSQILRNLQMNQTVEECFLSLGERSGSEDIDNFAKVLSMAKRTDGNIIAVIENTVAILDEKQAVKQEIETLIAGKRLEAKIMNMMPLGILLYLGWGMPELILPLYHNLSGILIMTIALFLYLASYVWSLSITSIKI